MLKRILFVLLIKFLTGAYVFASVNPSCASFYTTQKIPSLGRHLQAAALGQVLIFRIRNLYKTLQKTGVHDQTIQTFRYLKLQSQKLSYDPNVFYKISTELVELEKIIQLKNTQDIADDLSPTSGRRGFGMYYSANRFPEGFQNSLNQLLAFAFEQVQSRPQFGPFNQNQFTLESITSPGFTQKYYQELSRAASANTIDSAIPGKFLKFAQSPEFKIILDHIENIKKLLVSSLPENENDIVLERATLEIGPGNLSYGAYDPVHTDTGVYLHALTSFNVQGTRRPSVKALRDGLYKGEIKYENMVTTDLLDTVIITGEDRAGLYRQNGHDLEATPHSRPWGILSPGRIVLKLRFRPRQP